MNLPKTGQTTSYATNDDGAIQAGVVWPSPRVTDNGDQTMTDNLTGLIWAKDAGTPSSGSCTGGTMPWANALVYIACLNTASYLGYNDWRLPNINELESLVNAGQWNQKDWLGTQGYTNVAYGGKYWSSTTYAHDTNSAWTVEVWYGVVDVYGKSYYDQSDGHVWPVRAGLSGASAPAAIWATGQTYSYHFGDDGAIKAGAAWPSTRFVDNGDGTVTDYLTGLMWTKNANLAGAKSWQQALDYVANMNYTSSGTYGYKDWRLSNRKELRSLVDYSQYGAALPTGNPFTNVQSDKYMSSTSFNGQTGSAWINDMNYGSMYWYYKSNLYYFWPVRTLTYTLDVSKSGTGTGTITSSPSGISCGATCSASIASGTSVKLTATAASGSTFTSWSGCDSSSGSQCTVAMSAAKSVTATFTKSYAVSVSKSGTGTGTITSSPAGISCGSTCSASYTSGTGVYLTATAASGSTFSGYTGCDTTNSNGCYVSMSSAKSVTATFTASAPSTYAVSVTKSGTGTGTITSSPSGISCGATCSASYTSGTGVYLTATAASGSIFSGYTGCDTTNSNGCYVLMSSAKSVTATFASSDYNSASTMINAIYSQYPSVFGTTSGGVTTGTDTSGTYYVQWFTNGTAILAYSDGHLYYNYGGKWYSLGVVWNNSTAASTMINTIYSQYASFFGTKSGSITTGTSGSATYYVQWFTNAAAIVAWTDGTMYTYYYGTWYALGVSWK
ncbi:MAG: DUF1566 domain-containing protein [Nitrospirae bacterium]|nr:DUF1566 domain-containing protein [Nitrospirota bacterium]